MSSLLCRQQPGASTSRPCSLGSTTSGLKSAVPCCIRRIACKRGALITCASSGSGEATGEIRDAAERAFKQARSKWNAFAKEQRLEQRASEMLNKAGATAQEAAEEAKDKAKRMFVQIDSEYELSRKTARAARRAEETARDIDQTYGVRRRLRNAQDYVARMWPVWQQQLNEFGSTWYGKASLLAGLFLILSTPFFWSVLNFVLLLWWLSIPLGMVALDYARRQQQAAAAEAAQREAARRANPFADMFSGFEATRAASRGAASGGRSGGGYTPPTGPIIEAEWTSLDEDETVKRGSGSSSRRR